MPDVLDITLTTKAGKELGRIDQFSDAEVEIPLCDSRLARVTMPIHDLKWESSARINHVLPLERMLKIRYRGNLVFWGPMLDPTFDLSQDQVVVEAHDTSLYMKRHYLRASDTVMTLGGAPLSGIGINLLMQAAMLTEDEVAVNYADPGFVMGYDKSDQTAGEVVKQEIGANVWDAIKDLSDSMGGGDDGGEQGPEFDLVPIDDEYDPKGIWTPGLMAMMNAWSSGKKGGHKENEIVFHYGFGLDNLSNFIWAPGGSATRNRFVAVSGTTRVMARHRPSIRKYGILEGWEGAGPDRQANLAGYAKAQILAYAYPPDYFTITPHPESGIAASRVSRPWRYIDNYVVGDYIRATAKKGAFYKDLVGRIVKVTLKQQDQAENVAADLVCAPTTVLGSQIQTGDA